MQRHAVGQRDHAQIAPDLTNPHPVPDAPVLGLHHAPYRILQSGLAPLQTDVGPLFPHIVPEVVGSSAAWPDAALNAPERQAMATHPAQWAGAIHHNSP